MIKSKELSYLINDGYTLTYELSYYIQLKIVVSRT